MLFFYAREVEKVPKDVGTGHNENARRRSDGSEGCDDGDAVTL